MSARPRRGSWSKASALLGSAALVVSLVPSGIAQAEPAVPNGEHSALAPKQAQVAYPLQARSVAAHLSARNQTRLPRANRWATRILSPQYEQPAGLTEVQVVSALHIRRIFRKRLGTPAAKVGLKIAWRESRLLPNVVNEKNRNKTNDWGLFQLNDGGTLQYVGGVPGLHSLRPKWNTRAAARLIASAGWGPWGGIPS